MIDALLLFVRPQSAAMAAVLNDWALIKHVDGFVLHKLTLGYLGVWEQAMTNPALTLMPMLETADVFDPNEMIELGQALEVNLGDRIIALRIGGNDLMSCLSLRREPPPRCATHQWATSFRCWHV